MYSIKIKSKEGAKKFKDTKCEDLATAQKTLDKKCKYFMLDSLELSGQKFPLTIGDESGDYLIVVSKSKPKKVEEPKKEQL